MGLETGTEFVVAEVRDEVGIIILNRPKRRNALHPDMYEGIAGAVEEFTEDSRVGCILLTGVGTAFCAGGDVREGRGGGSRDIEAQAAGAEGQAVERLIESARFIRVLHESPKISVAALPGAAVGAGLSIALCTDFRVAAASAKLIPGWGKLGLSGDFDGTWFLSRFLGSSRALEVLVDNRSIDAAYALELGLVNKVVPDAELWEGALNWARAIASGPRVAQSYFKENVRDARGLDLREALAREAERMHASGQTQEHRDAVRACVREAREKGSGRR